MMQPVKPKASNDDIMYLLQKVYEKEDNLEKRFDGLETRLDGLEKKVDVLTTTVVNLAGDIKDIQENTTVLSHHNSEHFDKDDEQDKRLDTHAKKLGLPAFSY
jgi:chromosome segregation ATPase